MRVITWIALVGAALAAFAWGRWLPALALGGLKACLVGLQFMELRQAHPAHRFAFVGGVVALVGLLALVAAPA